MLDLLILDQTGKPARLWLTTVLDDYSRVVAGFMVFFGAPSILNTSLALRQAIGARAILPGPSAESRTCCMWITEATSPASTSIKLRPVCAFALFIPLWLDRKGEGN